MPVMEMRNPNWFQLEVIDHICRAEKDWGQFLHTSLSNNMLHIMSIYVQKQDISQEPFLTLVIVKQVKSPLPKVPYGTYVPFGTI